MPSSTAGECSILETVALTANVDGTGHFGILNQHFLVPRLPTKPLGMCGIFLRRGLIIRFAYLYISFVSAAEFLLFDYMYQVSPYTRHCASYTWNIWEFGL